MKSLLQKLVPRPTRTYALLPASFFVFFIGLSSINAAELTDRHGNVGYETLSECESALRAGTAKYYAPFISRKPLKRAGEVAVHQMRLKDLGAVEYGQGTCDKGVGRSKRRSGVSAPLIGKYIALSPDMLINAYHDADENIVRVTMQKCDNHFSGHFPMPATVIAKSTSLPVDETKVAHQASSVSKDLDLPSPPGQRVTQVSQAPLAIPELDVRPPSAVVSPPSTNSPNANVTPPNVQTVPLPPPAVVNVVWEISPADGTLRSLIMRWSVAAGWTTVWDATVDYPILTKQTYSGTFQDAVMSLFSELKASHQPLQGVFYMQNRVLRVIEFLK